MDVGTAVGAGRDTKASWTDPNRQDTALDDGEGKL